MSDVSVSMPMEDQRQHRTDLGWGFFTVLLLLVVGGAIIRSAVATHLDGFTIGPRRAYLYFSDEGAKWKRKYGDKALFQEMLESEATSILKSSMWDLFHWPLGSLGDEAFGWFSPSGPCSFKPPRPCSAQCLGPLQYAQSALP